VQLRGLCLLPQVYEASTAPLLSEQTAASDKTCLMLYLVPVDGSQFRLLRSLKFNNNLNNKISELMSYLWCTRVMRSQTGLHGLQQNTHATLFDYPVSVRVSFH
jgi:hypothetical protein